ncbi:MAG: hypothetical protein H7A35_13290 [Planctomycetales bacterium]|nr:MAG: hypothetical protein H7A35_13290 [Planctomycetales bacterium]
MRFDIDKYPVSFSSTYSVNQDAESLIFQNKHLYQCVNNHSIVWFRRIGAPGVSKEIRDRSYRKFANAETEAFILGLTSLLSSSVWINPYLSTKYANSKLFQLRNARNIGLRIPATLVTNSPDEVRTFASVYPKIIYKTLSSPSLEQNSGRSLIFSHLISDSDHVLFDQVKYAPCMFQQYIEKDYELRITFVGGNFYSVKIFSQDSSDTKIDWRAGDWNHHRYETTNLPEAVCQQLSSFMQVLNLQFGAIDMIVTPNGEYVFLEVNPHGAWLWLEQATDLCISLAISNYIQRLCSFRT